MTPEPEGKKQTEPHTTIEEEKEKQRRNQIFRSNLRERVL